MLVELSVGNFRSFSETVTFSMVAANIVSKDKRLDTENLFTVDKDLKLLKSAGIYGANGSGKSNLIKAALFMRKLIINSARETQSNEAIDTEVFRFSVDTKLKPSYFEIVFIAENIRYRYGFEVSNSRVESEWLYHTITTREAQLFHREGQDIKLSTAFKEGRKIEEKTRENALFLSVVAQFNGTIAKRIISWFGNFNIISGLSDVHYKGYTIHCIETGERKEEILQFVRKLDLGIEEIEIEQVKITVDDFPQDASEEVKKFIVSHMPENIAKVKVIHRKQGIDEENSIIEKFDLDSDESEGTRKLFALSGPLIDTLVNGKILLIDEFDARLHPLISCAILRVFNTQKDNPNNAQLVFTTHDTNLLSSNIFRRDQIWFTEKSSSGSSDLYSLVELKIRNDASFEKDYINGRYGAIPFIGNVHQLPGESNG